jgi:hypothetical protein
MSGTAPYRGSMRESYSPARSEGRERIRSGLAELISSRSMSTEDFWRATWVEFADEGDMYRQFRSVYTEFFGDERPAAR